MRRKHFVNFTENGIQITLTIKEYARRYGYRYHPVLSDSQTTHRLRDRLVSENWTVRNNYSEVHLHD